MHERVKQHRRWREHGIPAIIVTNVTSEELTALNEDGAKYGEQWVQIEDTPPELGHPVLLRAAIAPFLAHGTKHRDSYKWIFYGDDDTMVNFFALRHMLHHWDSGMPYIITDGFLQIPGDTEGRVPDTYSGAHVPRCLPCHFARDPVLTGLLVQPGRGNFTPAVGCPCTVRTACAQRPSPDLPSLQGGPERCMAALADPSGADKAVIFGGYGAVFSRGLFECSPFSNTSLTSGLIRDFLSSQPNLFTGGDILLSKFLAATGVWVTDPGSYWWAWEGDYTRASAFGATQTDGLRNTAERMLKGECGLVMGPGGGGAAVADAAGGGGSTASTAEAAATAARCLQHFRAAISEHKRLHVSEFGGLVDLLGQAWSYHYNATLSGTGMGTGTGAGTGVRRRQVRRLARRHGASLR